MLAAAEVVEESTTADDLEGTPRRMSLCAYTVAGKRTLVLPDTPLDERSRTPPIVVAPPSSIATTSAMAPRARDRSRPI